MRYMNTHQVTTAVRLPAVDWHISSRSGDGSGNCVEAGPILDGTGRIAIRHSHHPDGTVIVYTQTEWRAFIAGTKAGEFDFL